MRKLLLVAAVVLVPAVASAQQSDVAQAGSPLTAQVDAFSEMRSALRNLVVAQEAHFAQRLTYTTDLTALRYEASPEKHRMFVNVTHAGGRSWRGVVQHRDAKGRSCVIFIGDMADFPMVPTVADKTVPTEAQEGTPVCDKP